MVSGCLFSASKTVLFRRFAQSSSSLRKDDVYKLWLAITLKATKGVQRRRKWSCAFGIKLKVCLMMNEPEQNITYLLTAVLTLHGKGI